jgi:predicted ATP-binding protein involved in virulence
MRIKKISVEGLFGTFNHTIPLNQEERITIIHSPNGFGKTAILRLVDGVFNSRYSSLRSIPFKTLIIRFDNNRTLTIEKANPKKNGKSNIEFTLTTNRKEQESFVLRPLKEEDKRFYEFERVTRNIPYLERISPYEWVDTRNNEKLDLDDFITENQGLLPFFDELEKDYQRRTSEWFEKLKRQINVHFIKTERLQTLTNDYKRGRTEGFFPMKPTVSKHSEEVKDSIRKKIGDYASLTQTLERTFPKRLVDGTSSNRITQEKLKEKLKEVEEKRKELISTGLLEEQATEEPSYFIDRINESNEIALTLYAEDMTQKLKIFDDLAEKIEIFKDIINSRFQYKQMHVNKDKGVFFITDDGTDLSLRSLSSGEQQELVLFYEFLFQVKENSLILIDEPEISLHVAWQIQFLKDLSIVTQNAKFDVLLATHSPQIINDRWDLTVELKGKEVAQTSKNNNQAITV